MEGEKDGDVEIEIEIEQEFDDVRKKAYDVSKMMLHDRGYVVHETGYDPSEPPSEIVLVLVANRRINKDKKKEKERVDDFNSNTNTINVYMAPEEKQLGKGYVQEILGLNGNKEEEEEEEEEKEEEDDDGNKKVRRNHIIIITRCGLTSYVTKEMSAQK